MSILEIKNLTVHFHTDQGVVEAVDKVDLSIKKGETVGLVGESGCGKTTMGKTILRVLPEGVGKVVEGSIFFQGEDLLTFSEKEINSKVRGIAITLIPQDPFSSFNPVFTVGTQFKDIIRYKVGMERRNNGRERGLLQRLIPRLGRGAKSLITEMLKSVQISSPEGQLHKYPHEFSGGQRQRIMIAMALCPRPALIIADEPTTALDATIGAQILDLLRDLTKQFQTSALFITHDLGVASDICDRIAVMYAGQIMELAPVDSFFKKPCHPYTRALLDSLPNPEGRIQTIKGDIPNLINPPKGCRFHPRCSQAVSDCDQRRPDVVELFPDHIVRCFNPRMGDSS